MALTNPKLELALVEQMRCLLRKESIMDEASEVLASNLNWLVKVCAENDIALPDQERIRRSILHLQGLLEQIYEESPDAGHRDGITGERDTI